MSKRLIYNIFLLFLISAISFNLQAQSVKELENQRKQTLKQLETTSKMLNETKKSQVSSLNKIGLIKKNINERKSLIKNISTEINKLDNEMNRLQKETKALNNKLSNLKADYVKLVQDAHIHRSIYSKVMFVLSAESFDQFYRRMRYTQEFSEHRKSQVRKIEGVKTQIIQKTDSLGKNKITKVIVVKQKETEAQKLSKDEKKEKVLLTDLQKKEKKLRDDLKIQQKKAADLNNKIERIIAEEIRKAEAKRAEELRKKELAEQKKKPENTSGSNNETETSQKTSSAKSSNSASTLTKEETLISGNFAANSGRLPWPTEKGFISGKFGIHPHPVLQHVETNNKGIYIQTPAGTNARAVFGGVVSQVFNIPGSNWGVIVQHGDYRTVYANLTDIYIKAGDKISAKQSIGKIYTDDENDNKTELYFQIWKGRTLMNPENWIAR